jgi:hypothetical protein
MSQKGCGYRVAEHYLDEPNHPDEPESGHKGGPNIARASKKKAPAEARAWG